MNKLLLTTILLLFFGTTFSCSDKGVKEKIIHFMDNQVYYEIRGEGPRTLFFIHGWTGSRESWKYQLDEKGNPKQDKTLLFCVLDQGCLSNEPL